MRPEAISVVIGAVTFVVAILVILLILDIRSRRQKDIVVHRSFGYVAGPSGSANIDIPKEELATEPVQEKNRWRFYLFGFLAAGVFGTLLSKLWSLQLLSGDTYLRMADEYRR
ncbi:MAG: hypothetical protein LBU61_05550, partial [Coriobacteriales bacterium]|nr:hypothetical protein [Coriobacteriales bacterium]